MARIELEINGNATGLENASKKAATAVGGLTKSTAMSKAQIEAWDAAARRNSMEQYGNDTKRATASVNGLAAAQKNLNSTTNNLTNGFRGANMVGIEFSRIIQDAPYGIIGVGNNITQLTQSFANLRAQTSSTSQALGIAFRSMFSGANLLVLGVSAVTTAFTLYNMWARKNKKETDALNDSTKTYIETLNGVARAQADGLVAAQKDITNLRLLYEATQNLTLPMEDRRKAAQELINQYPKQFQGLTQEAVLAGNAASAYDKLSRSLIATATAMASVDRIRENSNKILNNRLQIINLQNEANELANQIAKEQSTVRTDEWALQQLGTVNALESRRNKILQQINELGKESGDINQENLQIQGEYNSQISKGADLSGKLATNLAKGTNALDAAKKLAESLAKLQQESIQASLTGYTKELQASQYKYDELKRQADEYYRQGKVSAREYANYISRLQGFRVGEAGRITGGAGSVPLGQKPSTTGVVPINIAQTAVVDMTTDPVWDKFVDGLDKQLSRSVQHFGRDFLRTLSTINQQANVTFGGIVSTLVGSITGGITEVFSTMFSQQLSGIVKSSFKDMGKTMSNIVAGVGIAGTVVSGAFKPTSVGGQALGGALSGAGAGLAVGGPIGAVIGGAIGAITGALGAASAKRIQEEQLAEQRKQTALLERANALSYASSIMGQMTAGGAVTGIMRDAFGQLVATVKGSDLQFVLQRSGGQR